ncbi:MAG: thermonuclease family protein [Bacilli bacterium]|nr:thermonuclease family protein [Bacilli bacterium]
MKKRLLSFLGLLLAVVSTGCNQKPYIADNTEHYDKITKTLKLNKNGDGKDFLTQGIGHAEVASFTDGDTVRFNLTSNQSVVIRFYSVDTPESTSAIQKWGKAASHFVESTLLKATDIVLEATDSVAKHDSYGSRYLGYVWYKTADYADFKCLNLEIVENGYSENTGINTSDFPYYKKFAEAQEFAAGIKLRTWSLKDDPDYDPSPRVMTIKEFYQDTTKWYNDEKNIGSRVKVTAYLSDLTIGNTGTYSFTASEYNAEENKVYSIDAYAGYSSSAASNMKVGNLYRIIGYISNHYGTWQISDINYATLLTDDNSTMVTQYNYYSFFDSKMTFATNFSTCIFTDITVASAAVENDVLTITGTAKQRTKDGTKGDDIELTLSCKVSSTYTLNISAGNKISVNAYQFIEKSNNYTVRNVTDIVIR